MECKHDEALLQNLWNYRLNRVTLLTLLLPEDIVRSSYQFRLELAPRLPKQDNGSTIDAVTTHHWLLWSTCRAGFKRKEQLLGLDHT